MATFGWRSRYIHSHLDADDVAKRLEELRKVSGGVLRAARVVEDAKLQNSPYHNAFTWDDGAAANKYREWQARDLMGSLIVIHQDDEGEENQEPVSIEIRAMENSKKLGGYAPTKHLLSHQDTREELLQKAWNELRDWRRRYEKLREFADIIGVIDELKDRGFGT